MQFWQRSSATRGSLHAPPLACRLLVLFVVFLTHQQHHLAHAFKSSILLKLNEKYNVSWMSNAIDDGTFDLKFAFNGSVTQPRLFNVPAYYYFPSGKLPANLTIFMEFNTRSKKYTLLNIVNPDARSVFSINVEQVGQGRASKWLKLNYRPAWLKSPIKFESLVSIDYDKDYQLFIQISTDPKAKQMTIAMYQKCEHYSFNTKKYDGWKDEVAFKGGSSMFILNSGTANSQFTGFFRQFTIEPEIVSSTKYCSHLDLHEGSGEDHEFVPLLGNVLITTSTSTTTSTTTTPKPTTTTPEPTTTTTPEPTTTTPEPTTTTPEPTTTTTTPEPTTTTTTTTPEPTTTTPEPTTTTPEPTTTTPEPTTTTTTTTPEPTTTTPTPTTTREPTTMTTKAIKIMLKKGEKGLKGDQGRPGIPGKCDYCEKKLNSLKPIQGSKGKTGLPGLNGTKGEKGDLGKTGFCSKNQCTSATRSLFTKLKIKGVKGEPGKAGYCAKNCDPGIQGDKGDKGKPGIQGLKGEPGKIPNVSKLFQQKFEALLQKAVDKKINEIKKKLSQACQCEKEIGVIKKGNQKEFYNIRPGKPGKNGAGIDHIKNMGYGALIIATMEDLERDSARLRVGTIVFLKREQKMFIKIEENEWKELNIFQGPGYHVYRTTIGMPHLPVTLGPREPILGKLVLFALKLKRPGNMKATKLDFSGYHGASWECQFTGSSAGLGQFHVPILNTPNVNLATAIEKKLRTRYRLVNLQGDALWSSYEAFVSGSENIQAKILDPNRKPIPKNNCIWIGKRADFAYLNKYETYRSRKETTNQCHSWITNSNKVQGDVAIYSGDGVFNMANANRKSRSCNSLCHVLCVQSTPYN